LSLHDGPILAQVLAADELVNRNWVFHKEFKARSWG
jgi:CCR4-NOT transcriptional regulation complex NOT5 subunit